MPNLCWLRRDLRLHDNQALSRALASGDTAVVFVLDEHILSRLPRDDRRVTFIAEALEEIDSELKKHGSALYVRTGKPEVEIPRLAQELRVGAVFCNRDYEPYAKARDKAVAAKLQDLSIDFHHFKDSVFFETDEVLNGSGETYKVFTPYKNRWLERLQQQDRLVPDYKCDLKKLLPASPQPGALELMRALGFTLETSPLKGGTEHAKKRLRSFADHINKYKEARDFPAVEGTSGLSPYLRFGCLSVRDMLRLALSSRSQGAQTWLSEIVWRDFYQMILDANPHVVSGAFKPSYDKVKFPGSDADFERWCEGMTGFPIVDAAMRCLNETGIMHNRLRMIVASFLTKTLLVHWQKGEAYFALKLLDFDLASNNGGWQWAASSGCDAQPYFRIFNPYTQSQKFDEEGTFIRLWCPELAHLPDREIHRPDPLLLAGIYPAPIVSYEQNRERALRMYEVVKSA
jgi:deoxyribodipyrimidine photo-lyase